MGIRVLLVDDEEPFVNTLAERLKTRNFSAFTAHSGKEAMKMVEENVFDVLVLDVLMPEMDGVETLRRIKQEHPLLEVIMLTGHATVETAIEGMKAGAFDYLMKPTEMNDLVRKIEKAFARKSEQESRIREAEIEHIIKRRGY